MPYVSEPESGLGNPSVDLLDQLAEALRVSLSEFFVEPRSKSGSARAVDVRVQKRPLSAQSLRGK